MKAIEVLFKEKTGMTESLSNYFVMPVSIVRSFSALNPVFSAMALQKN